MELLRNSKDKKAKKLAKKRVSILIQLSLTLSRDIGIIDGGQKRRNAVRC